MSLYAFKACTIVQSFDFVRLFLSQSITQEPRKASHKIILLTIAVTAVKVTNDFLRNTLAVQFDNQQVPFDSYKDLYKSELQTYSYIHWLKDPEFLESIRDQNLLKILNRTLMVQQKFFNCLDELKDWKNVSCIMLPYNLKFTISIFGNPDGSPAMKVAQPTIFTQPSGFYYFVSGSPYAMKFLEIMRRIRETSLVHWFALIAENGYALDYEETNKVVIDDDIDSKHLLMIMSFGFSISAVTFVTELILFRMRFKNDWFHF